MTHDQLKAGQEIATKISKIGELLQMAERLEKDSNQWSHVISHSLTASERANLRQHIIQVLERKKAAMEVQLHTL